jgi:hypothetical protein
MQHRLDRAEKKIRPAPVEPDTGLRNTFRVGRVVSLLRGRRSRGGSLLEAVSPAELLAETLHAAGGVDELLLAGEKGMTDIANIDANARHGAARHKRIPAGTVNIADDITGMNLGFHDINS